MENEKKNNDDALYNTDVIKTWSDQLMTDLKKVVDDEIEEIAGCINNEEIWESAYDGEGFNFHTLNIGTYKEYKKRLGFFREMLEHISV